MPAALKLHFSKKSSQVFHSVISSVTNIRIIMDRQTRRKLTPMWFRIWNGIFSIFCIIFLLMTIPAIIFDSIISFSILEIDYQGKAQNPYVISMTFIVILFLASALAILYGYRHSIFMSAICGIAVFIVVGVSYCISSILDYVILAMNTAYLLVLYRVSRRHLLERGDVVSCD